MKSYAPKIIEAENVVGVSVPVETAPVKAKYDFETGAPDAPKLAEVGVQNKAGVGILTPSSRSIVAKDPDAPKLAEVSVEKKAGVGSPSSSSRSIVAKDPDAPKLAEVSVENKAGVGSPSLSSRSIVANDPCFGDPSTITRDLDDLAMVAPDDAILACSKEPGNPSRLHDGTQFFDTHTDADSNVIELYNIDEDFPLKGKTESNGIHVLANDSNPESDDDVPFSCYPDITVHLKTASKEDSDSDSKQDSCRSLFVQKSRKVTASSKRKWDKKNACLYCCKEFAKLPRHLYDVHSEEVDVAKALLAPKGSKERMDLIADIRKRGNWNHNYEVLEKGKGEIKVSKRPSSTSDKSAEDFLPCDICYGFFYKNDLWRHRRHCGPKKSSGGRVQLKSAMMLPSTSSSQESTGFSRVLNSLKDDEISHIIKKDTLIIKLGRKLANKHGHEETQDDYIRKKLRQMGRLVQCAKKQGIKSLEDAVHPSKFPLLVSAVQDLAEFNEVTAKYGKPNLAVECGHSLNKCAEILQGEALIDGNREKEEYAKNFLSLMQMKWNECISGHALRTTYESKFNKPRPLPLGADVKKLNEHLHTEADRTLTLLETSKGCNAGNWLLLAKVTLTLVILFNRKRSGDASKLRLDVYRKGASTGTLQSEMLEMLTPFEQQLACMFTRLETRGKRGRRVPILLTKKMKTLIDILISKREKVGINSKNQYVFARAYQESNRPLDGHKCLSHFASECGAEKPELLTATILRKHVATMSQILNLKKNELDMLANYLGHDIRVHREFYRLPENTLQIAKVSRLLLAMETGNIGKFKGKSLEEIEFQDEAYSWELDESGGVGSASPEEEQHSFDEQEPDPDGDEDSDGDGDGRAMNMMKKKRKSSLEKDGDGSGDADGHDSAMNLMKKIRRTSVKEGKFQTEGKGTSVKKTKSKSREQVDRTPWSDIEKDAVQRTLGKFILEMKVPGKSPIDQAISKEPILKKRPWLVIKSYIYNVIERRKKKMKSVAK